MQQLQMIAAAQAQAQAQAHAHAQALAQNSPRPVPQPRLTPQAIPNANGNSVNPNHQMQVPQSSQALQNMQQQPGPIPQQGTPNIGGPQRNPNLAAIINPPIVGNVSADVMARMIRGNPAALAQMQHLQDRPQAQKELLARLAQSYNMTQIANAANAANAGGRGGGVIAGPGGIQGGGQGGMQSQNGPIQQQQVQQQQGQQGQQGQQQMLQQQQ